MRDATNGNQLVRRAREELGVELAIIEGSLEAHYAALGAVYGLPVESGALLDIGGGSMELAPFRRRTLAGSWTYPFGALRLTDRFLQHDPPLETEVLALRAAIRAELTSSGVPPLQPGEALAGTGGVIRNLAKIDRRARRYPLPRLHGYEIGELAIRHLIGRFAEQPASRRAATPGLNPARADCAAPPDVQTIGVMPGSPAAIVRQAAVRALAARFARWDSTRARQRSELVQVLGTALDADAPPPWPELLAHAAYLLDVGASIDFYNRNRQTATLVTGSDMSGFTHIEVARLAAMIRVAEDPSADIAEYAVLLEPADARQLRRSATLLALADELQRRLPPGRPGSVACRVDADAVHVEAPTALPWRPGAIARRLQAVFQRDLIIEAGPVTGT